VKYGSVCSGIEAATMAWHPLGWTPVFFSEIEAFPSSVLAHHYGSNMPVDPVTSNGVPNHGDMTKFEEWPNHAIDLLVGGTPCQSFSVAGLRGGLDDARGNLMLTYAAIARRYRPRWLVWENVPGVFSSDGGRDFASLLGLLSGRRVEVPADWWRNAGIVEGYQGAYGLAWRVLDAQYVRVDGFRRAVPQRRRRVFVVGYLGDWRRAAAVLFERESLRWDSAPRRQAGEKPATTISARPTGGGGLGTDFDCDGGLIPAISNCLNARDYKAPRAEDNVGLIAVAFAHQAGGNRTASGAFADGYSPTLQRAQTMAVAFTAKDYGGDASDNVSPTLRSGEFAASHANGGVMPAVATAMAVRRLTPRECERLMGFPDNFTDVPHRGKPAADGPRYKALGNSMAVNCMRWIGRRIGMVEQITRPVAANDDRQEEKAA
jgi:DNA (cytosine-5)-methyltransferase 1